MSLEYSYIDESGVAAEGDNQSALAASLRFELRPGMSLGPGGDSVTPAAWQTSRRHPVNPQPKCSCLLYPCLALSLSLSLFHSTGKWVISGSGVNNSVWQANSPKEFIKWDLKIREMERGLRWRRLCKLVELYSSALCALKILITFTQIEKSLTGIYKSIILIFITANSCSLSLYCLSSLSVRLSVRSSVCLYVHLFNQLDLRVCKSYGFQIRW